MVVWSWSYGEFVRKTVVRRGLRRGARYELIR